MCGIFGAIFDGGDVDVRAALATLRHRGPDASGVYRASGVDLGHTRLKILDLTEAAAQPMTSADGAITVVFNGEIYNHHELRKELQERGHRFRSRSDTEVIVEGYRAWQDGVVERLDGMFAIGIFDGTRRRLLLARDRAGKKPLFYSFQDGALRFASEIKALVASGMDVSVDVDSLPMMLALGYTAPPRSMYRGVHQLAPASYLTLEEGQSPQVRRYWRAPFDAEKLRISEEEAAEEVLRLLSEAVNRRLEADVPLGAFLSGGIDSTAVVALMARQSTSKVKTFCIGYKDPKFDETEIAARTSRLYGTDHTEFVLEPTTSFDLVQRLVELHDGPFGDSSAVPSSVVSMHTRRHVTVALSGDGGDELFCGYPRFLALEASEHMPSTLRRFGGAMSKRLPGGSTHGDTVSRVKRFLERSATPLAQRLVGYCSYFAFELDALLRPELRVRPSLEEPMAVNRRIVEDFAGARPLARVLAHTFETYLPYDLLVKSDRSSMMHSLELRAPFLDTKLIEFAARLPANLLRRGPSRTKWILKRALHDLLPAEVRDQRKKKGFGMPVGSWFRSDLKECLLDHFSSSALVWDYLDRRFVEAMLEAHFDGRRDEGLRLWLLLTLEVWLRSLRGGGTGARNATAA